MAFSRAALKAFETDLRVFVKDKLPQQAQEALEQAALTHKAKVEAEQAARAGVKPMVTAVVDGVRNAPLNTVKPNGVVLLDWNYLQEAVLVTVGYLRRHGPEIGGDWKRAISVEVGERWVDPTAPIPKDATEAFVFVNVPYARRLEIGKKNDGSPFVVQVEWHFIEKTVLKLRASMKSLATFDFAWAPMEHADAAFRARGTRRTRAGQERAMRVPGIRIREIQAL